MLNRLRDLPANRRIITALDLPAPEPALEPEPGSPVKVQVPVEGLGTLELTVNVSARLLEKGEAVTVEIDIAGAALTGNQPAPEPEPAPTPESTSAKATADRPEPAPEPAPEPEPEPEPEPVPSHTNGVIEGPEQLVVQEVPEKSLSGDEELPPLGEAPAEPLGAPLDGQTPDDFRIPDLPQEEKILLEEDLNTAESGPSSPELTSEYNPTVQPLEFDFPDTEPEEEPKKKGLFGRFKRK